MSDAMRKIIFPSIVAILLIAGFTGILSTKFFNNVPTKKIVIIDTDMGSDGWMAILYLLKQPNIDVRGIILDGNGVSFLPVAKENLKRILALPNEVMDVITFNSSLNLAGFLN